MDTDLNSSRINHKLSNSRLPAPLLACEKPHSVGLAARDRRRANRPAAADSRIQTLGYLEALFHLSIGRLRDAERRPMSRNIMIFTKANHPTGDFAR